MRKVILHDGLLIAACVAAALAALLALWLFGRGGAFVSVTVNGEEIARYPLSEDREVTVGDETHGFNRLVIRDGLAFVSDADCPDRLCVSFPAIGQAGQTVTCLPHRLVIRIIGADSADPIA